MSRSYCWRGNFTTCENDAHSGAQAACERCTKFGRRYSYMIGVRTNFVRSKNLHSKQAAARKGFCADEIRFHKPFIVGKYYIERPPSGLSIIRLFWILEKATICNYYGSGKIKTHSYVHLTLGNAWFYSNQVYQDILIYYILLQFARYLRNGGGEGLRRCIRGYAPPAVKC